MTTRALAVRGGAQHLLANRVSVRANVVEDVKVGRIRAVHTEGQLTGGLEGGMRALGQFVVHVGIYIALWSRTVPQMMASSVRLVLRRENGGPSTLWA